MHPDVLLGVTLDAICSRNRYTTDPQAVVDELLTTAAHRPGVLAENVGIWAGFWERDRDVHALCAVLLERVPGAAEWAHVGRGRAGQRAHGAGGIHAPNPPA